MGENKPPEGEEMSLMRIIVDGKEKWKWNRNGVLRDTPEEAEKDGKNESRSISGRTKLQGSKRNAKHDRNNDKDLSELDD